MTKKHYKGIDIYYIGYIIIKKLGGCESIHNINPMNLIINETSGDIEEKMEVNNWFLMILLMKIKHY